MQALPKNIRRAKATYNASGIDTEDRVSNKCKYEKKCTHCKEWFPADEEFFLRDDRHINTLGLYSWCRVCCIENGKQYKPEVKRPKRIYGLPDLLGLI